MILTNYYQRIRYKQYLQTIIIDFISDNNYKLLSENSLQTGYTNHYKRNPSK